MSAAGRGRRAGRYAVRMLVVLLVVGALVGVGYLWKASPAADLVADGGGDRRPPAGATDGDRRPDRFRDDGSAFSLTHADDLGQTMLIGVAVLAGVVVVDRVRRSRRPVRPTTN